MTRTDPLMPPCGPERDRLVAEAVGWKFVTLGTDSWCSPGVMGRVFRPSQSDADALAALEAWAEKGARWYTHNRWPSGRHEVTLYPVGRINEVGAYQVEAPTLRDAATAALVRWRNERSQS